MRDIETLRAFWTAQRIAGALVLVPLPPAVPQTRLAPAYIYTLREPDTGIARYVGQTQDIRRRLRGHVAGARSGMTARDGWVRELLARDNEPVIQPEETMYPCYPVGGILSAFDGPQGPACDAYHYAAYIGERERRWILHGLQQGWPLLNTPYANGHYRQMPREHVEVIQASHVRFLCDALDSPSWLSCAPLFISGASI